MSVTAHADTFVIDNLPPAEAMPTLVNLERLSYLERLNVAHEPVDVQARRGDLARLLDRAPDVPPMPKDAVKD